jgi:hypothetical protein
MLGTFCFARLCDPDLQRNTVCRRLGVHLYDLGSADADSLRTAADYSFAIRLLASSWTHSDLDFYNVRDLSHALSQPDQYRFGNVEIDHQHIHP